LRLHGDFSDAAGKAPERERETNTALPTFLLSGYSY